MMSCLIDNNNNKCNSLVLNVREGAKNTLRGCGFVRPSVTHLPYFFGLPSPPHFLKKVLTPPPITKVLGHPPFWKSYTPQKYQEKEEKTGYFCPQCSHFFRKGFDLPPFRVSVHILCNMITYISLPKKFPSSSLPPPFFGSPISNPHIFWIFHLLPSKKTKKNMLIKTPFPPKKYFPPFLALYTDVREGAKKKLWGHPSPPRIYFWKSFDPPIKKKFCPTSFFEKVITPLPLLPHFCIICLHSWANMSTPPKISRKRDKNRVCLPGVLPVWPRPKQ